MNIVIPILLSAQLGPNKKKQNKNKPSLKKATPTVHPNTTSPA